MASLLLFSALRPFRWVEREGRALLSSRMLTDSAWGWARNEEKQGEEEEGEWDGGRARALGDDGGVCHPCSPGAGVFEGDGFVGEGDWEEGEDDFETCAVPKKKISKRRRKMRNADSSKRIKGPELIYKCSVCGRMRLPHHVCYFCIKREKRVQPKTVEPLSI